ncbi:MAG: DUF4091 domain-containing protein [Victivallales bacterium]|nr:DUF4091 domain-containing protein [Victivallales bacterium]
MKKLLAILLVAVALPGLLKAERITLFDPESPSLRGSLYPYEGGYGAISPRPDGMDGQVLKTIFPKWEEGMEQWPQILIPLPKELQNLSYVHALETDIYSETYQEIVWDMKRVRFHERIELKPGWNHVVMSVETLRKSGYAAMSTVPAFAIFQSRPEQEIVFYMGRLTADVLTREEMLREYLEHLQRFPSLRGLQAQVRNALEQDGEREECLKQLAQWKQAERSELQQHFANQAREQGAYVGVALSCEQIFREPERMKFFEEPGKEVRLSLAKNEREAAQVVIYGGDTPLKGLTVRLSGDLTGPDGAVLKASECYLAPVGYMECPPSQYLPDVTGLFPDPLLTYNQIIDLDANCFQPWWVEFYAPKDQPAGVYQGELQVTWEGRENPITVPVEVTVNDFTLQDAPNIPMHISVFDYTMGDRGENLYPTDPAECEAWRKQIRKMMFDHRLTPDLIYRHDPTPVEEAKEMLAHGADRFNIIYVAWWFFDDELLEVIDKAIAEYKAAGIYDKAYIYISDEAPEKDLPIMKEQLQILKDKYPELPLYCTIGDAWCGRYTGMDKFVDTWFLGASNIERGLRVSKNTTNVAWYTSCGWILPLAENAFIEYPPLMGRMLMGVQAWKEKPAGYLYYCANYWHEDDHYRTEPMKGAPVITNWKGNSFENYNGDGCLLYPCPEGVVPSIRFKMSADGIEDALYYQLLDEALKDSAGMPKAWVGEATAILEVDPALMTDMRNYTFNPHVLLNTRERIAKLLEEYKRNK